MLPCLARSCRCSRNGADLGAVESSSDLRLKSAFVDKMENLARRLKKEHNLQRLQTRKGRSEAEFRKERPSGGVPQKSTGLHTTYFKIKLLATLLPTETKAFSQSQHGFLLGCS